MRKVIDRAPCVVEGCERPYKTKSMCQTHYEQVRRNGYLGRKHSNRKYCSLEGCASVHRASGYCEKHYSYFRAHGVPEPQVIELTMAPPSSTKLAKELGVSRQRAHQIIHKQKNSARRRLTSKVKQGVLIKPTICTMCEQPTETIEAHHFNYEFPLAVLWVCNTCHNKVHPHGPYSIGTQEQSE